MKKRIISAIIAATITLLPTAAFAATADVDGDGVVSYEDVNAIKACIDKDKNSTKYDVNEDGAVDVLDLTAAKNQVHATYILGDANDDGVVSLEDYNLVRSAYFNSERGIIYDSGKTHVEKSYIIPGTSTYLYDELNADVDQDGYITLNEGGAMLMMYHLESSTVNGDVNGDGVVNKKDLNLLRNYIMDDGQNYRIIRSNADYNKDGNVDIVDYVAIQHAIK